MRQKNYWSYFVYSQIRLVEGKLVPAVLLPHEVTRDVVLAKEVWKRTQRNSHFKTALS